MSNTNEKNWVKDILENASNTVRSWPDWMRRPEVRGAIDTKADATKAHEEESGSSTSKR